MFKALVKNTISVCSCFFYMYSEFSYTIHRLLSKTKIDTRLGIALFTHAYIRLAVGLILSVLKHTN